MTSSGKVQTDSSSVDESTASGSGTPHSSGGLEVASSDENMSSDFRLPI